MEVTNEAIAKVFLNLIVGRDDIDMAGGGKRTFDH